MSRRTPEFAREFSFKEWFGKLNSGLENQSNEKIYKQAFYNVVGSFLLVVFCVASWGVFMILEPFLKPLLWALLCGSVLHPFKYRISKRMHDWIDFLDNPSIIHLFTDGLCFPAYLFNTVTDSSAKFISNHVYGILTIASVALIHLIVPHLSFSLLWTSLAFVSSLLLNLQRICSSFLVVSIICICCENHSIFVFQHIIFLVPGCHCCWLFLLVYTVQVECWEQRITVNIVSIHVVYCFMLRYIVHRITSSTLVSSFNHLVHRGICVQIWRYLFRRWLDQKFCLDSFFLFTRSLCKLFITESSIDTKNVDSTNDSQTNTSDIPPM